MTRFVTLIFIILMTVPAASAQQRNSDEAPPRRASPQVERPVSVDLPRATPDAAAPETDAPSVQAGDGQAGTISDEAFEMGVTAGEYDVGGRWACGCEGEGNGHCRAIIEGRSLSCYPAEEDGCTSTCDLATTHNPQIGAGPRRAAGD